MKKILIILLTFSGFTFAIDHRSERSLLLTL